MKERILIKMRKTEDDKNKTVQFDQYVKQRSIMECTAKQICIPFGLKKTGYDRGTSGIIWKLVPATGGIITKCHLIML